ncbi:MAG: glycosyltransferase family 4 protein [Proteobacteria bacterium]|nr:glycosyltransferase family 4 protein [Desulfobulbaceae bacterium]MBU4153151.1 glycosyltransferase family 4 protein [Pseudomonadota bacterium]
MLLGINASRARSGGARAHLIGILTEGDPISHGFIEVHVWSYRELIDALPNPSWLIKHYPTELERSMLRQLWWERFSLPKALRRSGCDVLLNVDAGTVCRFHPAVTMSRDMLSYEQGEMQRFGWSKARMRLGLLRYMQNASLRAATGAVFLTRYAAGVIQQSCGALARVGLIPHGVGADFSDVVLTRPWPTNAKGPIRSLYVSNVAPYKHQWYVVRAIRLLRDRGFDVQLTLTGGGNVDALTKSQKWLDEEIELSDPKHLFVREVGYVRQSELPSLLSEADIFIFASSCENMPNTLVEAMAAGLPIACSDRGPMPEVLEDGGVYFDPENPESIAKAIEQIITNAELCMSIARRAKELAGQYSWNRCAEETFAFIAETYRLKNDRNL